MPTFLTVLTYGLLAGAATILGIYLVVSRHEWARRNSIYLISFSAGVLLATSIGHLLPEAQSLNERSLIWFLASFVAFYIVEHGLVLHSCREGEGCEVHPIGTVALLGIGLHSLLDGIIIGVGFEISYALGIIATISVLLHELPEGISTVSILIHSGFSRQKAIFYSWLVALATPFGAIVSYLAIKTISQEAIGLMLAIAAGSFLYVAASDLVPEIHKRSQFLNILLLLTGIALPYIVRLFV